MHEEIIVSFWGKFHNYRVKILTIQQILLIVKINESTIS